MAIQANLHTETVSSSNNVAQDAFSQARTKEKLFHLCLDTIDTGMILEVRGDVPLPHRRIPGTPHSCLSHSEGKSPS